MSDDDELWNAVVSLSRETTELRGELVALRAQARGAASAPDAEQRRLAARVAELERIVERQSQQVAQLNELRASPSYRLLRSMWRIKAFVRRPLTRAPGPIAPPATAVDAPAEKPPAPAPATRPAPRRAPVPERAAAPPPLSPALAEDRVRLLAADLQPAPRVAPSTPADLRVAAIVGEPLRAALAPECELMTFRPDNWREWLDARPPHLLIVESTWAGNGRSWQYDVGEQLTAGGEELRALVEHCKRAGIPAVFWATKPARALGPFASAARAFDLVFTADPSAELPGARPLPLAASAPEEIAPTADGVRAVYAGAYDERLPRRRLELLEAMLEAVPAGGLRIVDPGRSPWPQRFAAAVETDAGQRQVTAALAGARVVIGLPDEAGSMVPGCLIEAVAGGAAVVGPPHPACSELLGDAYAEVSSPAAAEAVVAAALGGAHDPARARAALLAEHTYERRLATIAAAADVLPA